MKQLNLKNLQIIHFILLLTVVLLFTLLRLTLDSEDIILKSLSFFSSLIGSMWGVILILITVIKDRNDGEQKFFLSYYRNLLINPAFLILSDLAFLVVASGLFSFMAMFQVVEFRTREPEVEVFLSSNELTLQDQNYTSLGVIKPDKPLKVRLQAGKKRFSFESLSADKKKDAKIIHLKPFRIGKNYVYQVNMN